ncbi:MAG: hypothetical protein GXP35_16575 [Actinobacteria bacterium]|nr:hypothetical protein [Actinomycetota bacterium]
MKTLLLVVSAIMVAVAVASLFVGSSPEQAGAFAALDAELRQRGMELESDQYASIVELRQLNLSQQVDEADLVVRIAIDSVSDPVWNSVEGTEYRTVKATITEVFKGYDPTADHVKFAQVEFRVFGSGLNVDSAAYLDVPEGPVVASQLSGDFEEGLEKLVFLRWQDLFHFGAEDEPIRTLALAEYFRGAWTYTQDGLVNVVDNRRDIGEPNVLNGLIVSARDSGPMIENLEAQFSTAIYPLGTPDGQFVNADEPPRIEVPESNAGTDFRLEFDGSHVRCVGSDCAPDAREWTLLSDAG